MRTRGTLRLATRGSTLARRQAETVAEALEGRRYEVDLVTVSTTGDEVRDELLHRLGRTGAFVHSLDEQVLAGDVDAAVHSMKDVPTEDRGDLVVAGVPERAPPGDVLVTPDGATLEDLPEGATVGTSSLRRRAQLLAERPDLDVQPLRGNVDTRVQKLLAPALQREHDRRREAEREREGDDDERSDDDERAYERPLAAWVDDLHEVEHRALERDVDTRYDAVVLAEAGLSRIGLLDQVSFQRLPTTTFVPAAGQGALAITAVDGEAADAIHAAIDHPRTRVETTVERTILGELGAGCVAPIGVHAHVQGEYVRVLAQVFDATGEESVSSTRDLPIERHPQAAREFADDLAARGAADLIDRVRTATDDEETDHAGSDSDAVDGDASIGAFDADPRRGDPE